MPRWPEHGGLTARRLEGFAHVEGGALDDSAAATFVVSFEAEPVAVGERVELVFDGVATVWEATLNDEIVASGTSMFAACSVDVGGLLREGGGNVLTIRCRALVDVLAEQPRRPRQRWRTKVVENAGALRFVRTAVMGRAPGFAPGPPVVGPWRPVWLVRRSGVQVDGVVLRPRVEGRDGVLAVSAPGLEGEVVVGGVSAPLVDGRAEIRVPDVALWWPHTHGAPALYDVVLRVDGVDVGVGRTGFRALGSDDPARCVVNDVEVFARGVVWTPVPEGEARATLELLRDAGFNMVRIPGIGVYEDVGFHDLCDELGLLVWQDFMFANMDYPVEDPAFREQVVGEAREVLARVGGRPSLAVLCGGSEIEQQAAMFGADPEVARGELLMELLPGAARAAGLGDVPYATSAPTGGAMPFHPREGIANWFGVGGYRRPLSDVRTAGVRFASECLAFANVPDDVEEHDLGVARDVGADWDFADVRDHYLRELWGVERDHPRYWELARQVTGELMAHVFGDWRRAESECGGGLILWSRDLRAGSGWGVVDVDGRPKAALRALAPVLQPRAVWITDEGLNGLDIHVANDAADALRATLDVAVLAGAQVLADGAIEVAIPARGVARFGVEELLGRFLDVSYAYKFGPPAHDAVVATLRADDAVLAQAVHFPVGPPLDAEAFALRATWRDGAVELESERLAWGVRIAVPGWIPEDDAFTLLPGAVRTVRMRPVDGDRSVFAGGRVSALNLIGEPLVGTLDLAP
jgi:beta-mannosidase